MTILSFWFWPFLAVSAGIYYLAPGRVRWTVLLGASMVFFFLSSGASTVLWLGAGVLAAWLGARLLEKEEGKRRQRILACTLALLIGQLALLKYMGMFEGILSAAARIFSAGPVSLFRFLAPLGVSYYTLSLIGYVLDVYWGKYPAEKNIGKCLLFACWFPQLTSGPITRYDHMAPQLYEPHAFVPRKVLFGIQRILWGLFKKLVIADRAALLVNTVFTDHAYYPGTFSAAALLLYALQLYTDFSGCMDIIMGASECFGVYLPENFDTPFCSQSVGEFWRRWHITMGAWFKDYLLYPILKSDLMQSLGQRLRKRFGKKKGKNMITYLGLLVLWLVIGVWHGGQRKFILASGLLPGFFLVSGEICQPLFARLTKMLRINTDAPSWHLLRMVRTFFCLCCSWVFVRAESVMDGLRIVRHMLTDWDYVCLLDGSLFQLGLDRADFHILGIGLVILWAVGMCHHRGISVREETAKQNIPVQYLVMLLALFTILIFGIYGPSYDASSFIYRNF